MSSGSNTNPDWWKEIPKPQPIHGGGFEIPQQQPDCPPGEQLNPFTGLCDRLQPYPDPVPQPRPPVGTPKPPLSGDNRPQTVPVNPDGTCPVGYTKGRAAASDGPEDNTSGWPGGTWVCVRNDELPEDEGDECCSEAKLCDGLTDILEAIVDSQRQIAEAIAGKWQSCDEILSGCSQELEKLIEDKIDAELRKYSDCQQKVAAGLCGTAEFEQQCAKYALTCAEDECSLSSGNYDGWTCSSCGKSPCCCNQGKCEPCEPEQPTDDKYYGWCDSVSGIVYVTKGVGLPPTPTSAVVSVTDTEIAALETAKQFCRDRTQPPTGPTQPPDLPPTKVTWGCDLAGYRDNRNLSQLQSNFSQSDFNAGWARVNEAIADIGIAGLSINDLGQIMQGLFQAQLGVPPEIIKYYASTASGLIGCYSPEITSAITAYSTFGMLQKQAGVDLSPLASPYIYAIQASCRNRFLDPDKAVAAYLANAISAKDLDTQWAIHGYCPESVEWYKEAARAKPLPFDLATMQMRGYISESEYYAGMRSLGYTEARDATNILKLRQQVPTMSDIIRFMVRDADDDTLVAQFQLDAEFDNKYRDQLKKWSEQQGIPEKMARYAWRSHWDIPSPTQLFQFWRRLRKDNKFGGENKLWDDISAALIQQDILPYWHEHYKAISYQPLGRVDIRRMFNIGSVPESDLESLYQQLGYSDDDAERQKKFAIRERNASIGRHPISKLWTDGLIDRTEATHKLQKLGFPADAIDDAFEVAQYKFVNSPIGAAFVRNDLSKNQFTGKLIQLGVSAAAADNIANRLGYKKSPDVTLKRYAVGTITRPNALNDLVNSGIPNDVADNILEQSDVDRKLSQVASCQRAVKRRFVTGELDRLGAENALTKSGTTQQRAAELVDGWACEVVAKGRDAAIPRLCEWLARGAINPADFLKRTERLGYDKADAALIMEDCLISVNAKRNAEAKRQAREEAAQAAAEQRKIEQGLAKAQQAAAALERARKQREATIARRQKQLLSATEKIIKKCDCPLQYAHDFTLAVHRRIQGEYALTADESLQAILSSVDNWDGLNFSDLEQSINLAASLLQVTEPELSQN